MCYNYSKLGYFAKECTAPQVREIKVQYKEYKDAIEKFKDNTPIGNRPA